MTSVVLMMVHMKKVQMMHLTDLVAFQERRSRNRNHQTLFIIDSLSLFQSMKKVILLEVLIRI